MGLKSSTCVKSREVLDEGPEFLEISDQLSLGFRSVESGGRMVGKKQAVVHTGICARVNFPVVSGHQNRTSKQDTARNPSQRHSEARLDHSELVLQIVGRADLDLVVHGVAVAWWPTLNHVGDVHLLALQPGNF